MAYLRWLYCHQGVEVQKRRKVRKHAETDHVSARIDAGAYKLTHACAYFVSCHQLLLAIACSYSLLIFYASGRLGYLHARYACGAVNGSTFPWPAGTLALPDDQRRSLLRRLITLGNLLAANAEGHVFSFLCTLISDSLGCNSGPFLVESSSARECPCNLRPYPRGL